MRDYARRIRCRLFHRLAAIYPDGMHRTTYICSCGFGWSVAE